MRTPVLQPTENNVIIVEAGVTPNAQALSFRELVRSRRDEYVRGDPRTEQVRIVTQLIGSLRIQGGRFLIMVSGSWVEMDETEIDRRIRQSLGDYVAL